MATANALILAGAGAKGAFEAGALLALARAGVTFDRVVTASAGALNGAVFATAIRAGRPLGGAERLVRLWAEDAGWSAFFEWSLGAIVRGQGLSTTQRIEQLIADNLDTVEAGAARPVDLRIVVTRATGDIDRRRGTAMTTFEHVERFRDHELETQRERLVLAAAASAAISILFAPVDDPRLPLGPCYDGGTVNNTPIKHAIDGTDIERVFILSPHPPETQAPRPLSGRALLAHLHEALVQERLFRDLREAEDVNATLERLAIVTRGLPADLIARIHATLPWPNPRPLTLLPIRPPSALPGDLLSGFSSPELRRQYLDAGVRSAEAALGGLAEGRIVSQR